MMFGGFPDFFGGVLSKASVYPTSSLPGWLMREESRRGADQNKQFINMTNVQIRALINPPHGSISTVCGSINISLCPPEGTLLFSL